MPVSRIDDLGDRNALHLDGTADEFAAARLWLARALDDERDTRLPCGPRSSLAASSVVMLHAVCAVDLRDVVAGVKTPLLGRAFRQNVDQEHSLAGLGLHFDSQADKLAVDVAMQSVSRSGVRKLLYSSRQLQPPKTYSKTTAVADMPEFRLQPDRKLPTPCRGPPNNRRRAGSSSVRAGSAACRRSRSRSTAAEIALRGTSRRPARYTGSRFRERRTRSRPSPRRNTCGRVPRPC